MPATLVPTKALTAQRVVAILKLAGHQSTGRYFYSEPDQGYRYEREGFRTWCKPGNPVTVEHCFAVRAPEGWRELAAARLMEYQAALEAAGIHVVVHEIGGKAYYLECSSRTR